MNFANSNNVTADRSVSFTAQQSRRSGPGPAVLVCQSPGLNDLIGHFQRVDSDQMSPRQ